MHYNIIHFTIRLDIARQVARKCTECNDWLCVKCCTLHARVKLTKDHHLFTPAELLSGDCDELLKVSRAGVTPHNYRGHLLDSVLKLLLAPTRYIYTTRLVRLQHDLRCVALQKKGLFINSGFID